VAKGGKIMTRDELREIISRITKTIGERTPETACLFFDGGCKDTPCKDACDVTTYYAVGEEG